MESLMRVLGRAVFYLLTALLLGWTTSLTIGLANQLLPDFSAAKYFSVIVFDGGVIVWLLVFKHAADGITQRGISLGMTYFDIVGVGLVTAAELVLGGQQLVKFDVEGFGEIALIVVGVWTFVNLAAAISFEISSPDAISEITLMAEHDKIVRLSRRQLQRRMGDTAESVSEQLAQKLEKSVLNSLSVQYDAAGGGGATTNKTDVQVHYCSGTSNNGKPCRRKQPGPFRYCSHHIDQDPSK